MHKILNFFLAEVSSKKKKKKNKSKWEPFSILMFFLVLISVLKITYFVCLDSQEKEGTASADWSTIYSCGWSFPIWGVSWGWNSTVQRRVSICYFPWLLLFLFIVVICNIVSNMKLELVFCGILFNYNRFNFGLAHTPSVLISY